MTLAARCAQFPATNGNRVYRHARVFFLPERKFEACARKAVRLKWKMRRTIMLDHDVILRTISFSPRTECPRIPLNSSSYKFSDRRSNGSSCLFTLGGPSCMQTRARALLEIPNARARLSYPRALYFGHVAIQSNVEACTRGRERDGKREKEIQKHRVPPWSSSRSRPPFSPTPMARPLRAAGNFFANRRMSSKGRGKGREREKKAVKSAL